MRGSGSSSRPSAAILDVDDVAAAPDERRYALPAGHAAVLIDPDEPVGSSRRCPASSSARRATMPASLDAYRTGDGVDWADYGPDVVEAQEAPTGRSSATSCGDWIAALPDIAARLAAATAASPTSRAAPAGRRSPSRGPSRGVEGRRHRHRRRVDRAGQGARRRRAASMTGSRSIRADAASADGEGRYDLVTIFEAAPRHGAAGRGARRGPALLAPGGAVLVADERVAEAFTAPGDEAERLFYGYSVLACLANGLVDQPSVGDRDGHAPGRLRGRTRARRGSRGFTILPIEHDTFRFYRLDP